MKRTRIVDLEVPAGGWTDEIATTEVPLDGPPNLDEPHVAEQVFETVDVADNSVPLAGDLMDLLSTEYFEQLSARKIRMRTKPGRGEALEQQISHLSGVILTCADRAGLKVREGKIVYRLAT